MPPFLLGSERMTTEPIISVFPVKRTTCTIDEALFFFTPEFIDEHIVDKEYPSHQTIVDLVDALRWQREQVDRYRKLYMEALKELEHERLIVAMEKEFSERPVKPEEIAAYEAHLKSTTGVQP